MSDDADSAVQRMRERLVAEGNITAKLGIVMVASPTERATSGLTVPIWKEYCRRHEMGFFLQEEPLSTANIPYNWAKVRVLLEAVSKVKWRYLMLVEPNSLPKSMGKSWEYMVKLHMRHRRYSNDKTDIRYIYCPWDCEEEYESPTADGACTGPILHGCILWSKKPKTRELVQEWYTKRKDEDLPRDATGPVKALSDLKLRNHDHIFLKDVAEDIGKKTSKYFPLFTWDKDYGWNLRDQIYDFIKKDKKLSVIANKASKEHGEL